MLKENYQIILLIFIILILSIYFLWCAHEEQKKDKKRIELINKLIERLEEKEK